MNDSWLRIDPTDPVAMARLRDFVIGWWSESVTEQAKAANDWTEAELTSALRLLKAKVLAMPADELVFILTNGNVSGTTH